jgi:hypothetical protein
MVNMMYYWNIFEYSKLMLILENISIKNIGAIIGEHLDVRKMAPTLGNICICKTVVKYSKLAHQRWRMLVIMKYLNVQTWRQL